MNLHLNLHMNPSVIRLLPHAAAAYKSWYCFRPTTLPFYVGGTPITISHGLAIAILAFIAPLLGDALTPHPSKQTPSSPCLPGPSKSALHPGEAFDLKQSGNGYYYYHIPGLRVVYLHRLLCFMRWGPGLHADTIWTPALADTLLATHACGNKSCCAPWHLSFGTEQENAVDRESQSQGIMSSQWEPASLKGTQYQRLRLQQRQRSPSRNIDIQRGSRSEGMQHVARVTRGQAMQLAQQEQLQQHDEQPSPSVSPVRHSGPYLSVPETPP